MKKANLMLLVAGLLVVLTACGASSDSPPQPTETPRPASRVVVPSNDTLTFQQRLDEWLTSLEARILGEYENVDGVDESQLAIYPVTLGNERQPNYAIFVRARVADGADGEATADALLERAQNAVETTLVEFSALLNAGDTFTNYRWTEVTDRFVVENITGIFASNAGEAPLTQTQQDYQVSFPTELRTCPRTSCPGLGSLPRGALVSLGDPVAGESVLGRQEWYVGDYFGLPVYVPFARVTRARDAS